MGKVKITLVKSIAKRTPVQRATLVALGVKKIHQTIEKDITPSISGMINQVRHLLRVENC
jgi:large subunit ribosomal protein L30